MFKLFTDGGARGNPGSSATGIFLFDENDNLIDFSGSFLGNKTNNSAEYSALLEGLEIALSNDALEVICHLDSELVVKQMNGEYQVKHEDMKELYEKVNKLSKAFKSLSFKHIPRSENKFADQMVNIILDSIKN